MGRKEITMLPYPVLYDLVRERQRDLQTEAERSRMIHEAMQTHQVYPRYRLRGWLGKLLISWGIRLQGDSFYAPLPKTRRAPYSG
jgi:hypothetical protein